MKTYTFQFILLLSLIAVSCKKEEQIKPPRQPLPVTGRTYTADEITAFKQMTFYKEQKIIKWQSSISIYIADTSFPYLTKEIDSIISEINAVLDSNFKVVRTYTRTGSSIQVYLTDRDTYLSQEPNAATELQNSRFIGYGYTDWGYNGYIYHGSAFVDMAMTGNDTLLQRYAIHHELMHTLGFLGHVQVESIYSIMFSQPFIPYVLDYTDFDKRMMQLLYNPSIKAGMSESDFNTVISGL